MAEPFERYPVAAYNREMTESLAMANNLVNRGTQMAQFARITLNMARGNAEMLADSPDIRRRFAAAQTLFKAEQDVQYAERMRRSFRAHYIKLLLKQRAIARRRLLFMHASGRAPWRGARPPGRRRR